LNSNLQKLIGRGLATAAATCGNWEITLKTESSVLALSLDLNDRGFGERKINDKPSDEFAGAPEGDLAEPRSRAQCIPAYEDEMGPSAPVSAVVGGKLASASRWSF
jgi:hypothetical protein